MAKIHYFDETPCSRFSLKEALREAVVNALAHRDYRSTGNVQVYIFKDRVEIVSPGGLPAGMTEADLGIKSIPRNPLLFGMLFRMDAVEHIGSGIKRIRNLCREYGVAEPRMEVSEHWFTVIFPRPTATPETTGKAESRPESRPESQPESLTNRILGLLGDEPLSKSDISARLGQKKVSGQLNKVIRTLLTNELIAFTIPEKPSSRLQKYRLTQTGKRILQKTRSKSP
jgi:ATP-dependent DNA helicase RecG